MNKAYTHSLKIILIIVISIITAILFSFCLPTTHFSIIYYENGGAVVSSTPLQLIFSLQLVNTILIVVFGYLIYTKK